MILGMGLAILYIVSRQLAKAPLNPLIGRQIMPHKGLWVFVDFVALINFFI